MSLKDSRDPSNLPAETSDKIDKKMHLLNGFRVARFFLVQNTKTGENSPNYHKMYRMVIRTQIYIKYSKWP
jgi:hypothetical protein